ncbi:MAG: hypothetical protein OEL55_03280 [Desulfobulbaceae bacterium]|nr:hypothetical protein [Desulfobulbaceae bacterium]
MSSLPKKCLVDTNIPIHANLVSDPANIPADLVLCVQECVDVIHHVMSKGSLVLDNGDEIYGEYLNHLCLSGRKGLGNAFMKWVHDNRWSFPDADRVRITKNGESFDQFPNHEGLVTFDVSDRKFVAVANAHHAKPTIFQATDSKWWGWRVALAEVGVTVHFLCPDYIETKYAKKIGA